MNQLYTQRKTVDGTGNLEKVTRSTMQILTEAEKRGIVWEQLPLTDLFKLTYKGKTKFFHAQIPSDTTAYAFYCCDNKRITRNILESAGLQVSKGFLIQSKDTEEYQKEVFKSLQKPVVIKPINSNQGKNVQLSITTEEDFLAGISKIKQDTNSAEVDVLVEEMFIGTEYRILATKDRVLSVIKRIPANVVGDGVSTIQELIDKKNEDPVRVKIGSYTSIVVDESLKKHLAKQKLDLTSVLPKGKQVFMREPNLKDHTVLYNSRGEDTIDVTDEVHESVIKMVEKIFESIPGLIITGVDYISTDITVPQTNENSKIIEINASPSLDWNEYPLVGAKREVTYEFLKIMFPDLK